MASSSQVCVAESATYKLLRSPTYNYNFNRDTGLFLRWGKTLDDDPQLSPRGPEIADIEISTGGCSMACPWCYKSNGRGEARHMSVETFGRILDKMPDTLTQVALGITDVDANEDFVPILRACRDRGVVPNYTASSLDNASIELMIATVELCGAVAISLYPHNQQAAFDAVDALRGLGMDQVNMHIMYHEDNWSWIMSMLWSMHMYEPNAVVLLALKKKGGGGGYAPMPYGDFASLVYEANTSNVPLGFDSCSAPKFERWAKENGRDELLIFSERCESSLFSIYVNVDGLAYPCSFLEGVVEPVSVLEAESVEEVWYSKPFAEFRERLLENGRECPVYDL